MAQLPAALTVYRPFRLLALPPAGFAVYRPYLLKAFPPASAASLLSLAPTSPGSY